jgi:hypothetical protein
MDCEIDYDIDKKKYLKEVKLFLSIAPEREICDINTCEVDKQNINTSEITESPHVFYPVSNFSSFKTKFVVENKEHFLNFYKQEKKVFREIFSNTFIVIATDENLTTYNKAIANFVQLCYGEELENNDSQTGESSDEINEETQTRIFITNFTLIKKLYEEDLKNLQVYLVPKEFDYKAYILFKKLDYVFRFIQEKTLKNEYFSDIVKKFKLKKLEINEKFLKIRNEFLRMIHKKNLGEFFKDPISKESIFPVLNIMILNYSKDDILKNEFKDEYHVNRLDLKFYESDFFHKLQKNLVNSDVTLVAYLDSDEMILNSTEYTSDFPIDQSELFVDKQISINFGKIIKIEEMGCGHYNFMKTCSGSLIYGTKFMPLGITTIKQNNLSLFNNLVRSKKCSNSNSFLPFSNKALLTVFKKILNIQSDFVSVSKDRLFSIERPISNQDKNIFVNKYLCNFDILDSHSSSTSRTLMYFNQSKITVEERRDKNYMQKSNLLFLNKPQNIINNNHNKTQISEAKKQLIEKLKNKSFNFTPFNKILQDKTKSLADYIDERIVKIFK